MPASEIQNSREKPEAAAAPRTATPAPSKMSRTKDVISILTTALPIIGAVGTLFVWLTANLYVGDVEVRLSRPYSNVTVKVCDARGQEATFNTPHFQLMPGDYHLVVTADDAIPHHADAKVEFHNRSIIDIELATNNDDQKSNQEKLSKKRWWQFWRKQQQN